MNDLHNVRLAQQINVSELLKYIYKPQHICQNVNDDDDKDRNVNTYWFVRIEFLLAKIIKPKNC